METSEDNECSFNCLLTDWGFSNSVPITVYSVFNIIGESNTDAILFKEYF